MEQRSRFLTMIYDMLVLAQNVHHSVMKMKRACNFVEPLKRILNRNHWFAPLEIMRFRLNGIQDAQVAFIDLNEYGTLHIEEIPIVDALTSMARGDSTTNR